MAKGIQLQYWFVLLEIMKYKERLAMNDFWKTRSNTKDKYVFCEDDEVSVYCLGAIAYYVDNNISTNVLKIAHCILDDSLDFNYLYGFYKIVIYDKVKDNYFFWGDNAGSQRFFVDYTKVIFADSLLALRNWRKADLKPCYSAIALLLQENGALTDETLVEGIKITDTEKYYTFNKLGIKEYDKGLLNFTENKGRTLSEIMDIELEIVKDASFCAVCTGGMDSRTILAHLSYAKKTPALIVTGHKGNPDIEVAKEVADALRLPLTIKDPSKKSQDWIQEAFVFSDGIYDTVLSYRHYQKGLWAYENGFRYEFGGVGGEFYKNTYCQMFRQRLLGKKVTAELLYQALIGYAIHCPSWAGPELMKAYDETKDVVMPIIEERMEKGLLPSCNRIGLRILQGKYCSITNNIAEFCVKIDPLMERDVIAAVNNISPLKLAMGVWQRREIKRFCPKLSNIKTDQGYSCSMNFFKLTKERFQRLFFVLGRIVLRIRRLLRLPYVDRCENYWNNDYIEASKTNEYEESIEICKKLGLINDKLTKDDIPLASVGNILQIGMFFKGSI